MNAFTTSYVTDRKKTSITLIVMLRNKFKTLYWKANIFQRQLATN